MSNRFDYLHQDEREWLRAVRRRSAVRRTRLLAAVVLVIALALTLLASRGSRELRLPAPVPAGPTAEQRAVEDGQRALDSWGRFAVTNDLRQLRDYFWPNARSIRTSCGWRGCGATSGRSVHRPTGSSSPTPSCWPPPWTSGSSRAGSR